MEVLALMLAERAPVLMLVTGRMVGLTMTFPVFASPWIPPVLRAALAFGLAAAVFPAVPAVAVPGGPALLLLLVGEVAVGMAAGFAGQVFFAAARGAGALVDLDMGFALAQVFDPAAGGTETVVARLYNMLALFMFFTLGGHLQVVAALAHSLQQLPPGALRGGESVALTLAHAFGRVLELAVLLALPAYAALLISTVVLAVLARAAPTLNLFAVGFNVKIPVALVLLLLALPFTGYGLQRLALQAQALVEGVLGGLAGVR